MTRSTAVRTFVAILFTAIALTGCASSRQYTQTVYSIDENGQVVAKEITKTRPPPKRIEGGDTSCTICGF